jgi:hypothetical protein
MPRVSKTWGDWICDACGRRMGRIAHGHVSCYHVGHCDYCDEDNVFVTEPRDWGYPPLPKRDEEEKD